MAVDVSKYQGINPATGMAWTIQDAAADSGVSPQEFMTALDAAQQAQAANAGQLPGYRQDPNAPPPTSQPNTGTQENPNYFDASGNPYSGQGTSYWYNAADQKWYQGDQGGKIAPYGSQSPWATNQNQASGGIQYYNASGKPYSSEDTSYWYNSADKKWYSGDAANGKVSEVGVKPPWQTKNSNQPAGNTPLSLKDLLTQTAANGGSNGSATGLPVGTLTLAALLGKPAAQSWQQPGPGYGDVSFGGGPSGHTTYFNQAGKQYSPGADQNAYWYNQPDKQWYQGDQASKAISPVAQNQLPWGQGALPWLSGNDQKQYFNEQGKAFGPGDQVSYWMNPADKTWSSGDMKGNITPATPPWLQR